MPIPSKRKGEDPKTFMQRCMSDEVMQKEFPEQDRRSAICMAKATNDMSSLEAADFALQIAAKEGYKYRNPKTGEVFIYERKGVYKKDGVTLVFVSG